MNETNYSAVDFSTLSPTDDGKTLLYANNQLCQSISSLSEVVDSKIEDKGYASEDYVNATFATKEDLGKVGNFIVTSGYPETFEPVLEPTSAETKSIYFVQNEDVSGKDQYYEWIVTENDDTKEWTCIGETTVDLKDYAKTTDVNSALALKQDSIARVGGSGPLFGNNMKYRFAPEGGTNLNLQEYNSDTSDWEDIGLIVTKVNKDSNKILKTNNMNILEWITPDYYTKSETSAASAISDALALKEDKVFVAEYNVTTYADIKAAYDAGKQIICQFNEGNFIDYAILVTVTNAESFVFNCIRNNHSIEITISDNSGSTFYQRQDKYFYPTTETSGKNEISTALTTKQDKLTFAGENNTITSINTSAVGTTLTAGTDLVINNGVIGVNTNGTIGNNANMSFVAGSGTSADGIGAAAFGLSTSAVGNGAFAVGLSTVALGPMTFAAGQNTSALEVDAHAEGIQTIASGAQSHAEGINVQAHGRGSHAEGQGSQAIGDYSHAEGNYTIANNVFAHAEGNSTSAIGLGAHAEGCITIANNNFSHAEGYNTSAVAEQAHAEGQNTIAGDAAMHVGGKYNSISSNAAFVIGNGTSNDARSDAFIVDWIGIASATKLATSGLQDVETTIKSKLDTSAIQFVSTSAEAVAGTQGVIYIVTGTNA